jgi:prepilin-type N-terminal cleavage/methylation domain-containing protein
LNLTEQKQKYGFSLLEVMIAMGILAIVSVGFLGALSTSSRSAVKVDQIDTGRTIAQAQMEWIKGQVFLSSGQYSLNSDLMEQYPGYSASVVASAPVQRDGFIQTLTVTVTLHDQIVATLEDCKTKR